MIGATASALIGVVNPLLAKLSALLEREYARLKSVRREIADLRDELSSMSIALEAISRTDSSENPVQPQVKEWMRQVRDLSHDSEDCIDVFLQDDIPASGLIRRTIRRLKALRARHCIPAQIAELRERAVVVNDRRRRYDFDSSSGSAVAMDSRLPAFFEEMDRLVGVDGPRDELVGWLIGEPPQLRRSRRAVSIVGFGGLGKTTLANQIYQQIKSQFDCTAFVSVSRNPSINKLLTHIFTEVLETTKPSSHHQELHIKEKIQHLKHQTFEDRQIISMIREHLQHNRYLIIIDDIWSKSVWQDTIQFIFPENGCASRIITTTRIKDVATACRFSHEDHVHVMEPLNSANSKRLFLKRIFGLEEKCPPELENVADDILKKCDGLPLAIVNIASLLSTKPVAKQEWLWVLNSIGSTLEQDHELSMVKRILLLSYWDLPHNLKICFLYLSIFPEDYPITRELLIWRWIAEGFITEVRGLSLEEVGEQCFNELINRNMIQLLDINSDSYRVHDIMLDIIISLSTEENFATIMDGQHYALPSNKIRRLSLQCEYEEKITWPRTASLSHARSLSVFGDINEMPPLVDLQVLRVLDLLYFSSLENDHIKNIASLFQLRYVRLGNISKMPRKIGKLRLLQTLDLRGTTVKELPESIVQLRQLVHLFLPIGVKLPNGIGNMEALQVLSEFDGTCNSVDTVQELGNLTKLKDLCVCWNFDGSESYDEIYNNCLVTSLCKLGEFNLRSLRIFNPYRSSVDFLADSWCLPHHLQKFHTDMGCYFSSLPKWISSLSEITCLIINVEKMEKEDLQVLKSLPALLHLDLYTRKAPKQTLPIGCSGFPCLKEFSCGPSPTDLTFIRFAIDTTNILGLGLMFEAGAMPKLQQLEFGFVAHDALSAYGVGFDLGIQHLTCLRHLCVIIDCRGASAWELQAVLAAISYSVDCLHSCHLVEICKLYEKDLVTDRQQEDTDVTDGRGRDALEVELPEGTK